MNLQLTVKELNEALNWMHKNDRYDQLVFYLEACESGSMFENVLKSSINGLSRWRLTSSRQKSLRSTRTTSISTVFQIFAPFGSSLAVSG